MRVLIFLIRDVAYANPTSKIEVVKIFELVMFGANCSVVPRGGVRAEAVLLLVALVCHGDALSTPSRALLQAIAGSPLANVRVA